MDSLNGGGEEELETMFVGGQAVTAPFHVKIIAGCEETFGKPLPGVGQALLVKV